MEGDKCTVTLINNELNALDKHGKVLKRFFPLHTNKMAYTQSKGDQLIVYAVVGEKDGDGTKLKKLVFMCESSSQTRAWSESINSGLYKGIF